LRNKAMTAVQGLSQFIQQHVLMIADDGSSTNQTISSSTTIISNHQQALTNTSGIIKQQEQSRRMEALQHFVEQARYEIQHQQIPLVRAEPRFVVHDYQVLLDTKGQFWQIDVTAAVTTPTVDHNHTSEIVPQPVSETERHFQQLCTRYFRILLQEINRLEKKFSVQLQ
jgi:G:T-mismatch repair DNA endonuclease (very short patch repair protein)